MWISSEKPSIVKCSMAPEILGSNLDKVKQELSLSAEEILDDTDPSKTHKISMLMTLKLIIEIEPTKLTH
jgi:hypothetical protein